MLESSHHPALYWHWPLCVVALVRAVVSYSCNVIRKNSIWIGRRCLVLLIHIGFIAETRRLPNLGSPLLQISNTPTVCLCANTWSGKTWFYTRTKFFYFFFNSMFSFWSSPKYNSLRGRRSTNQSLWTSGPSCGTAGSCVPLGRAQGYAVLLLEQGVLCVLPILWAALLFSEAGWDFWVCCVPAVSPRRRAGEGVERKGGGETWCKWQRGRGRQAHEKSSG